MMTEPLNTTAVAQSAVALVIALTLIETVRDVLSTFKPPRSEPRLQYVIMRIVATCAVIALAMTFIYLHPVITDTEPHRVTTCQHTSADIHNRPAARHI